MSSLPFWTRSSELVLWAELISIWILCSYWVAPDTGRANGTSPPTASERWRTAFAGVLAAAGASLLPPAGTGTVPRLVLGTLLGLTIVSAFCFALRGGTYVVRGILDKTGARPTVRPAAGSPTETVTSPRPLDLPELNRGRSIGHLERLLMVMVIGLGSYEALGFLIAAKGLIRAREFEDRDFAEYFILGSLSSAAVALTLGVIVRVSVPILWRLQP